MARKRPRDESLAEEEEAKRMKMKYASLNEDYVELQQHTRALRKKVGRNNDKKKRLKGEVRFLRRKYQMFTEKDCREPADPLVSPEFGAKALSVYGRPNEPTQVLATKDEPARCELTGQQLLMSSDHRTTPEMTGLQPPAMSIIPGFKVPHSSLVTPAVIDRRNEKIKADPFVSPECSAKIISIPRRSKKQTEGLAIEDKPARHGLTGRQQLSSTDGCFVSEIGGLQSSAARIMPVFKVPHSPLVTPTVEPANKKRHLENNGLISAQKPPKVKDGRIRKIKADPLVSPDFVAKTISISRRPKEPHEALVIEDEPARYELTGMRPLPSTDDCTLPEMTGLQPSAMKIMADFTAPHSSLVTPIVESANKKIRIKNNGLVSAQKPSNVEDSRNKKIKAALLESRECGAENLSIFRRPKEPTEALPIEDEPARHELTGLQLFSSADACTSPEMTGLQPSATRIMPAFTVPPGSLDKPVAKPALKKKLLENNGLVRAQKPSKVKDYQRKKIKDSPQKRISLIQEKGVESFWDN